MNTESRVSTNMYVFNAYFVIFMKLILWILIHFSSVIFIDKNVLSKAILFRIAKEYREHTFNIPKKSVFLNLFS